MSNLVLEVKERQIGKKSQLTEARRADKIPAIVYGAKKEPITIEVAYNPALKVLAAAGTSQVVNLKLGTKNISAIIREYQTNPLSGRLTHLDFLAIDEKHLITTEVPLEFVGSSLAVREKGGKLEIKNDKVEVECLPHDLPASIIVDVSGLEEIGQGITIGELKVSDKVTILNNPNDPVVDIIVPKKLEVGTVATAAEGAAPAEGEAAAEGAAPAEGEAAAEGAAPAEGAKATGAKSEETKK